MMLSSLATLVLPRSASISTKRALAPSLLPPPGTSSAASRFSSRPSAFSSTGILPPFSPSPNRFASPPFNSTATNRPPLSPLAPGKSPSSKPFASARTFDFPDLQPANPLRHFFLTLLPPACSLRNSAALAKPPTGTPLAKPLNPTKSSLPAASLPTMSTTPSSPSAPMPWTSPPASNPPPASKTPASSAPSSPKSPAPTAPSQVPSQPAETLSFRGAKPATSRRSDEDSASPSPPPHAFAIRRTPHEASRRPAHLPEARRPPPHRRAQNQ